VKITDRKQQVIIFEIYISVSMNMSNEKEILLSIAKAMTQPTSGKQSTKLWSGFDHFRV